MKCVAPTLNENIIYSCSNYRVTTITFACTPDNMMLHSEVFSSSHKLRRIDSSLKTILYIAVHELNAGWGAETFLAKAFEQVGHKVIRLDYRKHKMNISQKLSEAKEHKPDIILLQRGENFPIELLLDFPIPKIYYATEVASNAEQQDLLLSKSFDLYVAASRTTFDHMIHYCGIPQLAAYQIPSGYDPETYNWLKLEKKYNVISVCNPTSRRLKAFRSLGWRIRRKQMFAGAYGKACNDFVNQSFVNLNIHRSDLLDTETRLFELLSANTSIVSEECDSPDLFQNGGIQWFPLGDWRSMRQVIKNLIADNDYREDCIRRNNQIAAKHTWLARAQSFSALFSYL